MDSLLNMEFFPVMGRGGQLRLLTAEGGVAMVTSCQRLTGQFKVPPPPIPGAVLRNRSSAPQRQMAALRFRTAYRMCVKLRSDVEILSLRQSYKRLQRYFHRETPVVKTRHILGLGLYCSGVINVLVVNFGNVCPFDTVLSFVAGLQGEGAGMPSVQNVWGLSRRKGPLLRMVLAGEQVSLNGGKRGVLQGSNAAVTFFSTGDVVR